MLEMRVLGSESLRRIGLFLAFMCIRIGDVVAQDAVALQALTKEWENLPPSWTSGDPCRSSWSGVACNNSRITEITLQSMSLTGTLTGDLVHLSELQILDLSYNKDLKGPLLPNIGELSKLKKLVLIGCGFSGRIPNSIGSLQQLIYLSLNDNDFSGDIPASIGNLRNLDWLDLSDNHITGSIPVSSGDSPGLDLLVNTKHFHFGMNQLSGTISPRLFHSNMTLKHVLFDNNNLTGSIPSTLGLVGTLEVIRFDRNRLRGDIPSEIGSLTKVHELFLSNNALTGSVPDLSGMTNLYNLDLSNNSFDPREVPVWFPSLEALTTITMEGAGLEGQIPTEFFSTPQLQTVRLRNNRINGTLTIGDSHSIELQSIDLQNNLISAFTQSPGYKFTLMLADNPFCDNTGQSSPYCKNNQGFLGSSYTTPASCVVPTCDSGKTSSSTCRCAYPFTGTLELRAPSALGSQSYFTNLERDILKKLESFGLPIESLTMTDLGVDQFGYSNVQLAIFPSGQDYFNITGVISLAFVFSNQIYKPPPEYGPYVFRADVYTQFEGASGNNKKLRIGIIVGAVIGGSILFFLLICAGCYAHRQRKKVEKAKQQANPLSWDSHGVGGDVPQLQGARFFTLEELQRCSQNFSEANNIGSGGYGKVYKGVLPDGQRVAIKRSQQGSMQGSQEFKNEVELLSRVHHKNLVKLVGFCFDKGEQTLVYEYISNGTLMDSLSGKSGIQLDWIRRLMVTLGSARGLQYLHELADPPIIHRDIKSNNILLDERLNAKVADFGLSKLFGDTDKKGYVTTQVKGTMGYLDPEYYMTNQLTEKSDIFSFGVVMLEIITARRPIQDGKYIVKEIREAMDGGDDLYNLQRVMDPVLLQNTTLLVGFEKYVDLALKCVQDEGAKRPTMGEVVKEIEHIMQLAGVNLNAESATPSQTYDKANSSILKQFP